MNNFLSHFLKILLIYIVCNLTLSCSGTQNEPSPPAVASINNNSKVTNFLKSCEDDLSRAAAVISEKRLISILTHLNKMNNGGNYYYPLERDSLSKMLNQLSTYKYSECIITNKNGKIIYTMYNDEILGKSIFRLLARPFNSIVEKTMKNTPSLSDKIQFKTKDGSSNNIFFSYPIKDNNGEIDGVLIASIPMSEISKVIPENSRIITANGFYKFHPDSNYWNKKDMYFQGDKDEFILTTDEGKFHYKKLNYKNITWYLITSI